MATLTRDSNIIRLYDMQHAPTPLGDETEPTIIERSVHPCETQIGSFAWHPFSQNRMVVVSAANRAMTDFMVFERISLAWSPTTALMWACGRHLYNCVEDGAEGAEKDIATKMRQRAQSRYGHDTTQVWRNHLLAGGKDPQLKSLWYDLFYILLSPTSKKKHAADKVPSLLRQTRGMGGGGSWGSGRCAGTGGAGAKEGRGSMGGEARTQRRDRNRGRPLLDAMPVFAVTCNLAFTVV